MAQFGKGYAKRSTPSYFMAIVGVSVVLFLLGLLGWIVINANKLGHNFRENVEVQVYLRENVSSKDSATLVQYIASQPYVKSYEYLTKELARQRFIADGGKDWGPVLDKNPLPASVNFKIRSEFANPDSLARIKADLVQNIAVSEVQYNQVLVSSLNNIINEVSLVLLGVVIGISILVIILIDNTIRLAMFSNRFLIKTMQMVGATRWFIAKPMDVRALINGAISGLIAIGGIVLVIFFSEKLIPEIRALRDYTLLGAMFVVIVILGISISFISTHRSVLKYLKMKLDDLY
ncbi:MAG: permease-like cell division protein FtsX [Bacteroidota bacterium]|nr:permease-like cell division protein FtsX [Bacteroidota bacterium]MDP4216236.1 permease-like cell division protein FtsX [Bacteroidota bacterium]MDP4248394.1 permease-like cell division protein FtsX [Bacteroidota bacterium]MDP4256766.1 permease-like cell division protein FtsX [Bacteroidota bacterium]